MALKKRLISGHESEGTKDSVLSVKNKCILQQGSVTCRCGGSVTAVQRCVYHSLNYYSPAILIYFPYVYVLCFNVRQIVCCNICSLIRNDKERSNIVRALATCSVLSWPTVELCPLGRLRIFESESLDPFGRSEERVLPPFHPILNNVQKILNSSPRNPI